MVSASHAAQLAASYTRRQAARKMRGEKPLVRLTNRTLGLDDAVLAQKLLRSHEAWGDVEAVHRYEADFQHFLGAPVGVTAWSSGRVALSAALAALDLRPGDDVLVPGYTCVVVANALHYAGLNPVWVDIELDSYGPSIESVEKRLTPRTRAMIVQHLYGLVARDTLALHAFCRERGIKVIEDCTHVTGARYLSDAVGVLADVAFYSSEGSKIYSTIQGGLAVTPHAELHERLVRAWEAARPSGRQFNEDVLKNVQLAYAEKSSAFREVLGPLARRVRGSTYLNATPPEEVGGVRPAHYGRRMSAPVASLGSNQLRKLDRHISKRRSRAAEWHEWATAHGYATPHVVEGSEPVFLRYPVLVPAAMKEDTSWGRGLGVEVGVWFRSQLHPKAGIIESCPNAMYAVEHCVNMPTL